jgi:hypothetical protein
MTEPVVDRLEAVKVQREQLAGLGVAATMGHKVADPLGEQRPVRQTGERIVQGLMAQLGLALLTVGDVLDVDDAIKVIDGPDPCGADRHPDIVSVPAAQAALMAHDPCSTRPLGGAIALEVVQVVGTDDVEQDCSDQTCRNPTQMLTQHLDGASPDVPRQMITTWRAAAVPLRRSALRITSVNWRGTAGGPC